MSSTRPVLSGPGVQESRGVLSTCLWSMRKVTDRQSFLLEQREVAGAEQEVIRREGRGKRSVDPGAWALNNMWSIIWGNLYLAPSFSRGSDGKESACNVGDPALIPGSGRSPREGNGNPLQYSCLENFTDREAWWATVHEVAKSQTCLND